TEIVAGWFIVTRSLKFRIRVGHAQTIETIAFSAKNVPLCPAPPQTNIDPAIHRIIRDASVKSGNQQRIVELFQTVSDQAAPIHLQGVPSEGSASPAA
ncbi:hypothetical protein H0H81_011792, partial [Sphagnurus paluster]